MYTIHKTFYVQDPSPVDDGNREGINMQYKQPKSSLYPNLSNPYPIYNEEIPDKGKFEMNKVFSIFLFILTLLVLLGGIGNVIIRNFYGFKPEFGFIAAILVICGLLVWAGISMWRK